MSGYGYGYVGADDVRCILWLCCVWCVIEWWCCVVCGGVVVLCVVWFDVVCWCVVCCVGLLCWCWCWFGGVGVLCWVLVVLWCWCVVLVVSGVCVVGGVGEVGEVGVGWLVLVLVVQVDASYQGPRLEAALTREFVLAMLEEFKAQRKIHRKYV